MSETKIKERVKRLLWSRSGGYCQRPACNRDVFHFFEDGSVTSLEELAHVIAEKKDGPRGESPLTLDERNAFENLLVLCPYCHKLVDKNQVQFPETMLYEWKRNHERRILGLFRVPQVSTRAELRTLITPRLRRNLSVFSEYGPHSQSARTSPMSDAASVWERRAIDTIVPNNKYIAEVLERNEKLLLEPEIGILEQFKLHQEAFEYNHLSGDKNASAPLFPQEMNGLAED